MTKIKKIITILIVFTICSVSFYIWSGRTIVKASIDNSIVLSLNIPKEIQIGNIKDDIKNSDNITYPPQLATTRQQLYAAYSLKEQLRVEHNRVAELARTNWEKYESAYYNYYKRPLKYGGSIFKDANLIIEKEINRLRHQLLIENGYNEETWYEHLKSLKSPEAMSSEFVLMFGDRQELKSYTTPASMEALNKIKLISLDDLISDIPPDPTEDLTTYTEVDSTFALTVTSSRVTADALLRSAEGKVYKDFGSDYFNSIDWLLNVRSETNSASYSWCGGPDIQNNTNDSDSAGSDSCNIAFYELTSNQPAMVMYRGGASQDQSSNLAAATLYQVNLVREENSNTFICYIYLESSMVLQDTISASSASWANVTYQYAFALNNFGAGSQAFYGYTENFDLQEAGAEPDVLISPTSRSLGIVLPDSTYWTNTANSTAPSWPLTDGGAYFTVTNNGSMAIDITIKGTNFTGGSSTNWTLVSSSPSTNEARWMAWQESDNLTDNTTFTTSEQNFISSLAASADIDIELRLETGDFDLTEGGGAKTSTITLTAGAS